MGDGMESPSAAPPVLWSTYGEALRMFLRGATVPSAARIALVVGIWLSLANHGDALLRGVIPWVKIVLDFATPFTVASLGFLAARRRRNFDELLAAVERDRS
jgi:hypothetical protein